MSSVFEGLRRVNTPQCCRAKAALCLFTLPPDCHREAPGHGCVREASVDIHHMSQMFVHKIGLECFCPTVPMSTYVDLFCPLFSCVTELKYLYEGKREICLILICN